jgi:hypothetical protein
VKEFEDKKDQILNFSSDAINPWEGKRFIT